MLTNLANSSMFHRNRVILQMPLKVIHIYGDDSLFFFQPFWVLHRKQIQMIWWLSLKQTHGSYISH